LRDSGLPFPLNHCSFVFRRLFWHGRIMWNTLSSTETMSKTW
jgi:hypothetical protein